MYEISINEQNGAANSWTLNGSEVTPDEALKMVDEHEHGYKFDNENDTYVLLNERKTPYLQLKAVDRG